MTVSGAHSERRPARDPATCLVIAVVLFGTAVRGNTPGSGLAVAIATILVGYVIWLTTNRRHQVSADSMPQRILIAVLVFSILGALGWAPSEIGPTSPTLERLPNLIWAVLALWTYRGTRRGGQPRLLATVAIATVVASALIGVAHLTQAGDVNQDVNLLHRAAADAMATGSNPYTDSVEVPSGSPNAEPGETIVGYPYPPVTAVSYAIGEWVFSDPRYVSLISWVAALSLLGVYGVRKQRPDAILLILLLASLPGWPLVLRAGWTEPVTLALFTASFLFWRRPATSGIFLGLAVASKQYLIVAAPLLLLHRDGGWTKRLLVALSVAAVTVGIALAADFEAFWSAAVEFHMNTPVRTDSANLVGLSAAYGLDWTPPRFLSLAVGLVSAIVVGRTSKTRLTVILGVALSLAVSFLTSSQAFANYWFLVLGLCVLGLVDAPWPANQQDYSSPSSSIVA